MSMLQPRKNDRNESQISVGYDQQVRSNEDRSSEQPTGRRKPMLHDDSGKRLRSENGSSSEDCDTARDRRPKRSSGIAQPLNAQQTGPLPGVASLLDPNVNPVTSTASNRSSSQAIYQSITYETPKPSSSGGYYDSQQPYPSSYGQNSFTNQLPPISSFLQQPWQTEPNTSIRGSGVFQPQSYASTRPSYPPSLATRADDRATLSSFAPTEVGYAPGYDRIPPYTQVRLNPGSQSTYPTAENQRAINTSMARESGQAGEMWPQQIVNYEYAQGNAFANNSNSPPMPGGAQAFQATGNGSDPPPKSKH